MGPARQWLGPAQSAQLTRSTGQQGTRGPTGSDPGGGPRCATSAGGAGDNSGDQKCGGARRTWPEERYGALFGACFGSFGRAFNAASIYGSGAAVNGRKLRRRAAERTPEFGPRANCGWRAWEDYWEGSTGSWRVPEHGGEVG